LERTDLPILVRPVDAPSEEFPFPGFSRELVGLKAGESKSLQHDFPENAPLAPLAATSADFEATVKTVRSVTLPELDDEFAKLVGKYDSLDALKEALTKEIEGRARSEYEDTYYAGLVDQLRQEAVIKYAPQTLEHEAEHVVDDMRRRLAQQGLDLEAYYKMRNTDAAKFLEEEAKPVGRKRLERSLILDEVARLEKIEVDNEALDQEFTSTLLDLQGQGLNLNSMRGGKQAQQKVAEALAVQSASRLLTRRTLERLRAIATGELTPAPEVAERGQTPKPKTSAAKSVAKTAKKSTSIRASKTGAKKTISKK
jgi:trigger factor